MPKNSTGESSSPDQPLDREAVAGYALVRALYGKPSLIVRVDSGGLDTFIGVHTAHPAIHGAALTGAGDGEVFRGSGRRGAHACTVKNQLGSASLDRCVRNALTRQRRGNDMSG